MQTRKDVLEKHHDSALGQLLESEINVRHLERQAIVIKPGEEHAKLQKVIAQKKQSLETVRGVLKVIRDMIKEEGEDKPLKPEEV